MLFAALFLALVPGDAPIKGVVHRPQYHLIPQGTEAGWISDPNGPIYANGKQCVCKDLNAVRMPMCVARMSDSECASCPVWRSSLTARRFLSHNSSLIHSSHLPIFSPPISLSLTTGRYHMFYQGTTAAHMRNHPVPFHTPDPVSWGHMSSPDLTHWEQHPMAIEPAQATSYEGADVRKADQPY